LFVEARWRPNFEQGPSASAFIRAAGNQGPEGQPIGCSELNARGLEPDVSGFLPHKLAAPANEIDPMSLLLILSCFVPMPLSQHELRAEAAAEAQRSR